MLQVWIDREQLAKNQVEGVHKPAIVVHNTLTGEQKKVHEIGNADFKIIQSTDGKGVRGTKSLIWMEITDMDATMVTKDTCIWD